MRRILTPAECIGGYPTPRNADGLGCGVGCRLGLGGAPEFTPASLVQPGDSWLWADLDAALAVERNTQPVLLDPEFDDAAKWTIGANWAVVGGLAVKSPGAANSCVQDIGIIGNRYVQDLSIPRLAAGAIATSFGTNWISHVAVGNYTDEGTQTSNTGIGLYGNTAGDGDVAYIRNLRNLSVKKITCRGNLGNLEQATAANMPWDSDVDAPSSVLVNGKRVIYSDGVADYLTAPASTAKFNFLHNGAGGILVMVFRRDAGDYILSNGNASVGNVGIAIRVNAVYVSNASAAFMVNQAIELTAGAYNIVEIGMGSAATGYDVVINGTVATGAYVGAPSVANASHDLDVFRRASGNYMQARLPFLFARSRYEAPDSPGRVALRSYLKAYYAI